MIWLGCEAGAEELTALAEDLDQSLARATLAALEDRPFKSHLTIGRNRSDYRVADLGRAIQSAAQSAIGTMQADRFILFASDLHETGPTYTEVEGFKLGGG